MNTMAWVLVCIVASIAFWLNVPDNLPERWQGRVETAMVAVGTRILDATQRVSAVITRRLP